MTGEPALGFRTDAGAVIGVDPAGTVVGRGDGGLDDPLVSVRHLSVLATPQGLLVTDLDSTNGTWMNGRKLTTATLRDGDVIRVGHTLLRVVVDDAALPPPLPPAARTAPAPPGPVRPKAGPATSLAITDGWQELLDRTPGKRGAAAVRWLVDVSGVPYRRIEGVRQARNMIAHKRGRPDPPLARVILATIADVMAKLDERDRR
ncbi:FHA domain-containing protein [Nonomuraea dietziae]|uniref:FHA domain-containing protein n=1 Tax=Nonomuraea dietziae TaxID=65515 RepID=UPI0034328BA8